MNPTVLISISTIVIGAILCGVIFYMQSNSDDDSYMVRSKWTVTIPEESITQTWYIDTKAGAIRIESPMDQGSISIQEFVNGNQYQYFMALDSTFDKAAFCTSIGVTGADCDTKAAEQESRLNGDHVGDKSSCTITENSEFMTKANKAVENADGSLTVGGFAVTMVDGVPTEIRNPNDDSVLATIDSVEEFDSIDISGCSEESGSRNLRSMARNLLSWSFGSDAWDFFQTQSHSQWCGAGTDPNTKCPGDPVTNSIPNYDYNADHACRRHDHGKKAVTIWGGNAVRLGCDIDNDLRSSTSNYAVQGTFGKYGASQFWGCYDYGTSTFWSWCDGWIDYPCRKTWTGEFTKYGPWRYDGIKHTYGYKRGEFVNQHCAGDLF
jgi:hypothetical protein